MKGGEGSTANDGAVTKDGYIPQRNQKSAVVKLREMGNYHLAGKSKKVNGL